MSASNTTTEHKIISLNHHTAKRPPRPWPPPPAPAPAPPPQQQHPCHFTAPLETLEPSATPPVSSLPDQAWRAMLCLLCLPLKMSKPTMNPCGCSKWINHTYNSYDFIQFNVCDILGTRTQQWVWCLANPAKASRTAMKTGMAFSISVLSTFKFTSTIWDDTETLFTRGPSAHHYPRSAPARHIAVASKGRIPPPSDSFQIERSATISSKSLSATNLVDIAHATKKMQLKSKRSKFNGYIFIAGWLATFTARFQPGGLLGSPNQGRDQSGRPDEQS